MFTGKVTFRDKREEVDVTLTSAQDALVDIGLLADSVLAIDFVDRTLEVARK